MMRHCQAFRGEARSRVHRSTSSLVRTFAGARAAAMKRNQRQAPVARPVGYVPPARRGPLPGAYHAGRGEEQKHSHPLFATLTTRSECVRFAAAHVPQVGEAVPVAGGAMPRLERRYGWHLVQKGQSRACLSPAERHSWPGDGRARRSCIPGAAECVPPARLLSASRGVVTESSHASPLAAPPQARKCRPPSALCPRREPPWRR